MRDDAQVELVDFRGAMIYETQAGVLSQLEDMVNKKFTLTDEISYSPMQFGVDNYQVNELSLFNCGLYELPDIISNLTSLKIAFFNNNHLTKLPSMIANLKELKRLELDNNKLTQLPQNFSHLSELSYLSMAFNYFSDFPEGLCGLKKLLYLDFSKNVLTSIPESILNLAKLNSLWLEGNQLNLKRPSNTRFFLETLSYNGVEIYL